MAAIIAQMTRANRERKRRKRVETSKCMYKIPAFDPTFDAEIHNNFLSRRKQYQ